MILVKNTELIANYIKEVILLTLAAKIENANRLMKANDLIIKAIENEKNEEILVQMLELSQAISDVHKACIADVRNVRKITS